MKKSFFIKAYTKTNLGDDLFVKILCDRFSTSKFFIYAPKKYSKIFSNCKNLKVYSFGYKIVDFLGKVCHKLGKRNIIKSFIQKKIIKRCDAIIIIGGSLFIQKGLPPMRTKIKIIEDKELLRYEKPIFLIGSNFGPYEDEKYYKEYKNIFKQYKDICFREIYSYNLFKDLENVRVANDVVFNLKKIKDIKEEKNSIAISVMDFRRKANLKDIANIYEEKIVEIIKYYLKNNYKVKIIGFCEIEGDKKAIKRVINRLNYENKTEIEEYCYNGNIEECLEKLSKVEFIIATRFHSMILGYALDKKVFTLSYGEKTTNVIRDLNQENNFCDVKNIENMNIEKLYNTLDKSQNINIKEVKQMANSQFKGIEEYLGGEYE